MAEITLEKIDIVKERTGVSYEEAKRYLEENNGNVVEAIVAIEREQRSKTSESYRVPVNKVVQKVKELIKEGNVTHIRLKHEDKVILDLPVTFGVIAVILAPVVTAIGAIAAVASHCTVEVERKDSKQEE